MFLTVCVQTSAMSAKLVAVDTLAIVLKETVSLLLLAFAFVRPFPFLLLTLMCSCVLQATLKLDGVLDIQSCINDIVGVAAALKLLIPLDTA